LFFKQTVLVSLCCFLCKKAAQVFFMQRKTCINNNQYKNLRERFMKTRTKLAALLMLLTVLSIPFSAFGQVTVGAGIEPLKGALLDLKKNAADPDDNTTSNRGLLLPRVRLNNPDPAAATGTDGLAASISGNDPAESWDLQGHTGLTVYNLTDDCVFCPGIYVWSGTLWEPYGACCPSLQSVTTGLPKTYSVLKGATLTLGPVTPVYCRTGRSTPSTTYQWYKNTTNTNTGGTPAPNTAATGNTYTLLASETAATGTFYYYCKVINSCNNEENLTSDVYTVTVKELKVTPNFQETYTCLTQATPCVNTEPGAILRWYAAATGGAPLAQTTANSTGVGTYTVNGKLTPNTQYSIWVAAYDPVSGYETPRTQINYYLNRRIEATFSKHQRSADLRTYRLSLINPPSNINVSVVNNHGASSTVTHLGNNVWEWRVTTNYADASLPFANSSLEVKLNNSTVDIFMIKEDRYSSGNRFQYNLRGWTICSDLTTICDADSQFCSEEVEMPLFDTDYRLSPVF
jgi:hypothetical protein